MKQREIEIQREKQSIITDLISIEKDAYTKQEGIAPLNDDLHAWEKAWMGQSITRLRKVYAYNLERAG